MNLVNQIAKRYLFGKKSTSAINIITWISILGIAIGTAALVLILSVFNGFEKLLVETVGAYNSDLKVTSEKGIYLTLTDKEKEKLKNIEGVKDISFVLEEVALFEYGSSQEAGFIKGVDNNFSKVNGIDQVLHMGEFVTEDQDFNFGILGNGMYNKLSVSMSDPFTPISVYLPDNEGGPLSSPFKVLDLYPKGVFSFGGEQDHQYIVTNIDFVRALKGLENEVTGLELKLNEGANEKKVKAALAKIIPQKIQTKNRYEMDESFLKIMNIERWVSFLIAMLTLAIISFNMVGSLWMIVLDKKKDISILKSVGLTSDKIKAIFKSIGLLIGFIGFIFGMVIALILYFLQKNYSLIAVPDGFLIEGYPIDMQMLDIVLVFFVVVGISYLASLLPAIRAGRITAFVRQE
jgi:lipoprotein-releasing system permease protein